MACHHQGASRQPALGIPQHAIDQSVGEESDWLATPSSRFGGIRGGCPARLRTDSGERSSNRQDTRGAARESAQAEDLEKTRGWKRLIPISSNERCGKYRPETPPA